MTPPVHTATERSGSTALLFILNQLNYMNNMGAAYLCFAHCVCHIVPCAIVFVSPLGDDASRELCLHQYTARIVIGFGGGGFCM